MCFAGLRQTGPACQPEPRLSLSSSPEAEDGASLPDPLLAVFSMRSVDGMR